MGLPQLETCCFVLDLKTGNIVLGCFNAVLSFAMFITMIVTAVMASAEKITLTGFPNIDAETEAGRTGFLAMCIVLVFLFFLKFLFDIIFIYGVVAERAGVIKAYFIMWVVFFLLSLFVFFLDVTQFNAATVCTQLFYIGLNIYMILLSHSFYKLLNSREEV